MAVCNVCFRHCNINEGQTGFCGARVCKDGGVIADNYGRLTALALDPIEKKPLHRFHPGSQILSVGSYGCNLRCPFCQNHEISWSKEAMMYKEHAQDMSPEQLAHIAKQYKSHGNIGVAFTYNEPLIGFEFVRDTAKMVHEAGMVNVLVTNGCAELSVFEEISPYIDAMNIDLKGVSPEYYSKTLGGDLVMVQEFIKAAVKVCHVELTTLIIPNENDSEDEIRQISDWVSHLTDKDGNIIGRQIPLHISRFFPHFNMTDRKATSVKKIYRLADIAREKLDWVYTGNC